VSALNKSALNQKRISQFIRQTPIMDLWGATLPQKWLIHSAMVWRVACVSTDPVLFIGMCGKEGAAALADRQRRLIFRRFEE
jgi:hypothetical protein